MMGKLKIKKGDLVKVIAGNAKNAKNPTGEVLNRILQGNQAFPMEFIEHHCNMNGAHMECDLYFGK